MDYEPMWAVVDAHRKCANELERTLRELTGDPYDQPAEDVELERDNIRAYYSAMNALTDARDGLLDMADREGHSVRRKDASRCRVFARRCEMAIDTLGKSGEL